MIHPGIKLLMRSFIFFLDFRMRSCVTRLGSLSGSDLIDSSKNDANVAALPTGGYGIYRILARIGITKRAIHKR